VGSRAGLVAVEVLSSVSDKPHPYLISLSVGMRYEILSVYFMILKYFIENVRILMTCDGWKLFIS